MRGLALPWAISAGRYIYSSNAVATYERSLQVVRSLRAQRLSRQLSRRPQPDKLQCRGIIWSTTELRVAQSLVSTMRQLERVMRVNNFKAHFPLVSHNHTKKRWSMMSVNESSWTREHVCAGLVRGGRKFWETVAHRPSPQVPPKPLRLRGLDVQLASSA